jgi:hypothetical protein
LTKSHKVAAARVRERCLSVINLSTKKQPEYVAVSGLLEGVMNRAPSLAPHPPPN